MGFYVSLGRLCPYIGSMLVWYWSVSVRRLSSSGPCALGLGFKVEGLGFRASNGAARTTLGSGFRAPTGVCGLLRGFAGSTNDVYILSPKI